MLQQDNYSLRQKLSKQDIEIHRLKQENDQLHKEINQLKRMEKMAAPVPKYSSFHARNFQDPQSAELEYASQLNHVEVTDLEKKLEKAEAELRETQAELHLNQGGFKYSNVELKQILEKVLSFQRL